MATTCFTAALLCALIFGQECTSFPEPNPSDSSPIADAGDNQQALIGDTVTLDGSNSSDPDDDELAFSWEQFAGTEVSLNNADTATPSFTAPTQPDELVFKLTVDDGNGGTDMDVMKVTMPEQNSAPTANAGNDQQVVAGDTVTLNGNNSSDPDDDVLSFFWKQISGTEVSLNNADTASPSFTAPQVPDTLEFELTVLDGTTGSKADTIIVTVTEQNAAPIADPGENQNVFIDTQTALDASASSDPDTNDTLSYFWEQAGGTAVTLSDSTSEQPTFTSPNAAGELTFEVTVTDNKGASDTATVMVTVDPLPRVRLKTSMGDVVIEILITSAPITGENFLQYVKDGFYNGTIFHRILAGFIVQGGGFLPGFVKQVGLRDPIVNEFSEDRSNVRDTVATAKLGSDPDSATSQFFFNLADNSANLDAQNGGFTVFAIVIEGMDVVDAMAGVAVDSNGIPAQDVLLISATIE